MYFGVFIPIIFTFAYTWLSYRWFHLKGTLSAHSFNVDYLSIHDGSCGYLFHEIPGIIISFWFNLFVIGEDESCSEIDMIR